MMRVYPSHSWDLDYREAAALQARLSAKVRFGPLPVEKIRRVAGADIAVSKSAKIAVAAIVVLEFPSLETLEERFACAPLTFPYIPGLLSFREIPALMECAKTIETSFDALICDGQGLAHPRGFGLACHVGLVLRKPTIGCAKSLLVGEFAEPGRLRGDFSPLRFNGRRVGSVLRTQDGISPVYVSPGRLVDHASARRIVLACAPGYRLPEPIRRAHTLAGDEKRKMEAGG